MNHPIFVKQRKHSFLAEVIVGVILGILASAVLLPTVARAAWPPDGDEVTLSHTISDTCLITITLPSTVVNQTGSYRYDKRVNAEFPALGAAGSSVTGNTGGNTVLQEFDGALGFYQVASSSPVFQRQHTEVTSGPFFYFFTFPNGNEYKIVGNQNSTDDCDEQQQSLFLPLSTASFLSTTNTRFLELDWASTTLDIDYYLDEDEVDPTISELNPELIRIGYSLRPTSTQLTYISEEIDPEVTGTSTLQTDFFTSLPDGTYDLFISFHNYSAAFGGAPPFPDSYVFSAFTVSSGNIIGYSEPALYDATSFFDSNTVYRDCGLTSLDGCMQNVFIWLFYPTWGVDYFLVVREELETKIPFNYVFGIQDQIDLLASGSATIPSVTLSFGPFVDLELLSAAFFTTDPWATPFATIRSLSIVVLYTTLVIVLYRRTKYFINNLNS